MHAGNLFMPFCRMLFFFKLEFFRLTIRVSSSLDPDQARRCVGPALDPNSLHKLSAVKRVNGYAFIISMDLYNRKL